MGKWILALALLMAGLGLVMYQLFSKSGPEKVAVSIGDAAPLVQPTVPPDAAPYKPRTVRLDAQTAVENTQLDPQSEEFSTQLDVGIPDRFRAGLARCNRKGFDPDAKISFSYTLTIRDGVVSASNVQIESSDLGDTTLENCMVGSLEATRWTDPELPDFSEDQDLFLRIRSLNKYLDESEQKSAKQADKVQND